MIIIFVHIGTISALRCLGYFLCKKEKLRNVTREDGRSTHDSHIPYLLREVPVSICKQRHVYYNDCVLHLCTYI